MSRQQPEAVIVNKILRAIGELPQTYARKTHGSRYSVGWPDIVGVHRGRMFAIEVKQPGKHATARQRHELAKWELAGALVGVAHDVDEALAVIGHEPDGAHRTLQPADARYVRAVATSDSSGRIVGTHAESKADWDQPWKRMGDMLVDMAHPPAD